MSECWLRKMRTHFRRIDFDNNGIMSKRDFELMAESICAAEKIDPVKEEKLKKHAGDIWLIFMGSTKADEKGLLTEAVMIDSLKKRRNDPKLKASIRDICRGFYDAVDTNEDGFLQLVELRRAFGNAGISDTSFVEETFKATDTNHDGKLSLEEFTRAYLEFMFSEDEDSPFNLFFGPLI